MMEHILQCTDIRMVNVTHNIDLSRHITLHSTRFSECFRQFDDLDGDELSSLQGQPLAHRTKAAFADFVIKLVVLVQFAEVIFLQTRLVGMKSEACSTELEDRREASEKQTYDNRRFPVALPYQTRSGLRF